MPRRGQSRCDTLVGLVDPVDVELLQKIAQDPPAVFVESEAQGIAECLELLANMPGQRAKDGFVRLVGNARMRRPLTTLTSVLASRRRPLPAASMTAPLTRRPSSHCTRCPLASATGKVDPVKSGGSDLHQAILPFTTGCAAASLSARRAGTFVQGRSGDRLPSCALCRQSRPDTVENGRTQCPRSSTNTKLRAGLACRSRKSPTVSTMAR